MAPDTSRGPSRGSSRFSPPDCYQLSQAGTSSLLRSHLPPCTASFDLEFPLESPYPQTARTIQGFPSYFGLPVCYSTLTHATGLTRNRASRYLARSPTREAVSGSLALCAAHFLSLPSDPAVTGNALAIRIVFPLVGATPVSFNRPGLPATLGKQDNKARSRGLCCFRCCEVPRLAKKIDSPRFVRQGAAWI